jgi:hypothetical protein
MERLGKIKDPSRWFSCQRGFAESQEAADMSGVIAKMFPPGTEISQ